jgi:hypothetical protein
MNVRELRKRLAKFPPDAEVGIQDQDAGEHELSARVADVLPFDPELCEVPRGHSKWAIDPGWADGVLVVIRCG